MVPWVWVSPAHETNQPTQIHYKKSAAFAITPKWFIVVFVHSFFSITGSKQPVFSLRLLEYKSLHCLLPCVWFLSISNIILISIQIVLCGRNLFFFLLLNSIQLHKSCISLSINLLITIWIISILELTWVKLLQACM